MAVLLASRRQALDSQLEEQSARLQALRAHARLRLDAHLLWVPPGHESVSKP